VVSEKLYQAVKSGRIRPDQLNDEGKAALRDYITAKNNPAPSQSYTEDYTPERKRPTLDTNALVEQGVFESAVPEPPKSEIGTAIRGGILNSALSRLSDKYRAAPPDDPWMTPEMKQYWTENNTLYPDTEAKNFTPNTTVEKIAYGGGQMVGDAPLFIAGQGIIGNPVTAKLLPKLGQLGARTAGAAATGAGIGGAEALAEGQPLPEAAKTIAGSAATWGGGELGFRLLGKGVGALRGPTSLPKIESLSLPKTLPELLPPRASLRTRTQDYTIDNAMGLETGTKSFSGRTDWIPPVFNRSGGQVSTVPAPQKPSIVPSGFLEAPAKIREAATYPKNTERVSGVPFFDSTETGRMAGEQFIPFSKAQGANLGGFSTKSGSFSTFPKKGGQALSLIHI